MSSMRRVAPFAGTTTECFIYGTAAALVFHHVFFPALGAGTVAAIATAIGSDRFGRRRTILAGNVVLGAVFGLRLPETRHRSLRSATLRAALAEG